VGGGDSSMAKDFRRGITMARSKSTKKKTPVVTSVKSLEEAKKLIETRYKTEGADMDYIVLENAAVFEGPNKHLGLKYARKFKWKHFEVKG